MNKMGYVVVVAILGLGCVRAAQAHVFVGMSVGMPMVPVAPVIVTPPVAVYAPPAPYSPYAPYYYAPPPVAVYAAPPPVVAYGYWGHPHYAAAYWR